MKRLIEYTVFSGLVTDWRFATVPTSRSPLLVKATTDGVVRPPSWFGITTAWPPSMTDTTELVVPKSIPMILLILPSISRLRIRLVLACNHYQTLVCYCQADMSRSPVMCPTATSERPDLPWAIGHRRNHCGARTPACRVHTRVNAGLRHVANGTGHIYRLPRHVGWASDKVEVPL